MVVCPSRSRRGVVHIDSPTPPPAPRPALTSSPRWCVPRQRRRERVSGIGSWPSARRKPSRSARRWRRRWEAQATPPAQARRLLPRRPLLDCPCSCPAANPPPRSTCGVPDRRGALRGAVAQHQSPDRAAPSVPSRRNSRTRGGARRGCGRQRSSSSSSSSWWRRLPGGARPPSPR